MRCQRCGVDSPGGKFCNECGAPLINSASQRQVNSYHVHNTYPPNMSPVAPRKSKMPIWAIVLISVFGSIFLLILFIFVISLTPTNKSVSTDGTAIVEQEHSAETVAVQEPEPEPEPEYIEVTATQLLKDYDENEIAADEKYKGKLLKITGTVGSIGRDIFDDAYITLVNDEKEWSLFSVQCYFKDNNTDQLIDLKPGDVVVVVGTCDGSFGNVDIENCDVIEVNGEPVQTVAIIEKKYY